MTTSKIHNRSDTGAAIKLRGATRRRGGFMRWFSRCVALPLMLGAAAAANLYWDANGLTNGAGGPTPSGTWGTDAFWSTSALGTGATTGWTNGETAIFSAGGDATGSYTITLNGTQTAGGVSFKDGTATLSAGTLSLNPAANVLVFASRSATIGSTITGTTWTKSQSGTLTLTGANSFSSALTLAAGRLRLGNNSALGSGSISVTPAGDAFLQNAGANVTIGNTVSVNGGGTFDISSIGGALTLNGIISGTRTLWTVGNDAANTVVFGANNSFGGNLQIKGGSLVVSSDGALGSVGGYTEITAGATLGFQGDVYYNTGEIVKVSGNGVGSLGALRSFSGANTFFGTLDLQTDSNIGADAGSVLELAGTISGSSYDVRKVGPGTLVVSGLANSYQDSDVSAGTLQVDSGLGSGTVTVNAAATLSGGGSAGAVNLFGKISPGTSLGSLDTGTETWNGGGTYLWEINSSTNFGSPGRDPGWDVLNITGNLVINSGTITIKIVSLDIFSGDPSDVWDFDPTVEADHVLASTTGGITGFNAASFAIDDSAFSNAKDGGRFVVLQSGNDLVLRFDPKPVITCPANIAQANDPGVCGASIPFAATATDNDTVTPPVLTYKIGSTPITSPHIFPVGVTTVDATATDSVGNTDTCSFTVTVTDAQAPAIAGLPANITVQTGGGRTTCDQVATWTAPTASDNCGVTSFTSDHNSGDTFPVGMTTVTYTAKDAVNNTTTGSFTVTVQDNTVPVALTRNITRSLALNGTVSIAAAEVNDASSDNCNIASLSVAPNTWSCTVGDKAVTLTVTDNAGNVSTAAATVTITTPPYAPAPHFGQPDVALANPKTDTITDVTLNVGQNLSNSLAKTIGIAVAAGFQFGEPAGVGAGVEVGYGGYPGNTNRFRVRTTATRNEWEIYDTQNSAVAMFVHVVPDTSLTVEVNPATMPGCLEQYTWDLAVTIRGSIPQGTIFKTASGCGAHTFPMTFTSYFDQVVTRTGSVTLDDGTAPIALCQPKTIELDSAGRATLNASDIDNSSTDNCTAAASLVKELSKDGSTGWATSLTYECDERGANTVTLRITDAAGNASNCTATVTVQDNINPVAQSKAATIQLNAGGAATLTVADIEDGSTDNCAVTVWELSKDGVNDWATSLTYGCGERGANTVTLRVKDASGNEATTTATVTVQDSINPVAQCKPATIQLNAGGAATLTAADIENGSTDNCAVTVWELSKDGSTGWATSLIYACGELGPNTVTLRVKDAAGNANTCTATVTVQDVLPPTVISQNISVNLDADGRATITPAQVNNGSTDNCGTVNLVSVVPSNFTFCNVGANTVTLTVNDGHGNTAQGTATVTVVAPAGQPAIVYVDDDYGTTCAEVTFPATGGTGQYYVGYNAFNTVQAAINAVAPGGTVRVAAGTYAERPNISKSITLLGAQAGVDPTPGGARANSAVESIITEAGLSTPNPDVVIEIPSGVNNVVIDGFTLNGDQLNTVSDTSVIRCWGDGAIVRNNIIDGMQDVIFKGGTGFTLEHNRVVANKTGFVAQPGAASNVLLTGNTFTPGTSLQSDPSAINLTAVTGAVVSSNTASGWVLAAAGRALAGSGVNNLAVFGNTFTGNRDAISIYGSSSFITITNNVLTGSVRYGINIKGQDVQITGNVISGSGTAAVSVDRHLIDTLRVSVAQNDLSGSPSGLIVVSAQDTVNGINNWWGHLSGPASASLNFYGTGSGISGNATFNPWLASGTDTSTAIGFQPAAGVNYIPTHLAFSQEPVGAALGNPLATQPIIEVRDANETVTPWAQPNVALAIGNNPGVGVLTGTIPQPATLGVATFTGLAITVGGGSGYTVVASAPSLTPATSAPFDIANPAPTLASMSPFWKRAGDAEFTLTVTGANFIPNSKVQWDGAVRPTTYVDANTLTAVISAGDIATVGTKPVTVLNEGPDGGTSSALTFRIEGATPTVVYVDDGFAGLVTNTLVDWPHTGAGTHIIGYDAFATVQGGVNAVAADGTVHVAAGTYAENVLVNKRATVRGPNYGVSPGGARLAEAVIVPPTTNSSANVVVTLAASSVCFDGFTVDGDNPALPDSGVRVTNAPSASVDALHGIYANADGLTNVVVSHNIVQNVSGTGIRLNQLNNYFATTTGATFSYNNVVEANRVLNIGGSGIRLGNSMYAAVRSNEVANALYGVVAVSMRTENKGAFGTRIISDNTVHGRFAALWFNLYSASTYTVSNNTFGASPDAATGKWYGVIMATVSGAQNFMSQINLPKASPPEFHSFVDNTIDGSGMHPTTMGHGYWFWSLDDFRDDLGVDHFTTISGGSIANVDIGVFELNVDNDTANTGFGVARTGAHAQISGTAISVKSGGRGIYLKDDPSWTTGNVAPLTAKRDVKLTIGSGVSIAGGAQGLVLEQPYASVQGAVSDLAFSGQSAAYIQLVGHASNVDATTASFDGKFGSAMTQAELFAVEDRIHHASDVTGLGLVRVKAANVFVTTSSGSIQRGVNAATASDTVNVDAGTYRERVTLNKSITVIGDPGSLTVAGPGPNAPILDGDLDNNGSPDMGDGFTIPRNTSLSGITVEGFIIRNFGNGGGGNGVGVGVISWENTSANVTVRDNTFMNLGYNGVYVGTDSDDMQSNWLVQRNIIHGAPYAGIELTDVSNCQVLDNVIHAPSTIFDDPGDAGVGIEIAARARVGTVTTGPVLIQGNIISGAFASGSRAGINLLSRAYNSGAADARLSGITVQGNEVTGTGTSGIKVVAESRNGKPSRIENLSITQNTLTGNATGILVGDVFTAPKANGTYDVGTITIQQNNLELSSAFGLNNLSSATVNAPQNWWGNLSGPTSATVNPFGTGVPVGGVVTVSPWLASGTDTSAAIGFQPAAGVNYQPTHLVFVTQPVGAALGSPLATQPVIEVRDLNEVVTPWAQPDVGMVIGVNPGGGVLTGTIPKPATLGIATFTDLAVTVGGGNGFTLVASAPSLTSATSAPFNVANSSPAIASLSPFWIRAGSADFTLEVTGTGFVPNSKIHWNGVERATAFVSSTKLTTLIATAEIATPTSVPVKVVTTTPGGGTTAELTFRIEAATPTVVYVDDGFAGLPDDATTDWPCATGPGTPCPGSRIIGYDAFDTVQEGVNAVAVNGTVNVAAGTYLEAVEVSGNLTLRGAGSGTIIKGSAAITQNFTFTGWNSLTWEYHPVIWVHGTDNVTIEDLVVDGDKQGGAYVPHDSISARYAGVAFDDAGGRIEDVEIKNVMAATLDGGGHHALIAHGDANDSTLVVNRVSIHDFGKAGAFFSAVNQGGGSLDVTMTACTVTGAGATTALAQNGIEIEEGATGTISGNTVSEIGWIGSGWTGTGIAAVYSGAVTVSGNTLNNAQSGIALWGAADGSSVAGNTIGANNLVGPTPDIGILLLEVGDVTIGAGNTIDGTGYGWGLYLQDVLATSPLSLGDLAFANFASGNYITLDGIAPALDATGVSFEGKTGSAMTLAECFAAEDRITHQLDDASLELVRWKSGNLYVTTSSGSIQRGVDAATVGDTVNVAAGTYAPFTVNKSVTVAGEDSVSTIVDAGGGAVAVNLSAGNSTLQGFTIQNASLRAIQNQAFGIAGVRIENNIIQNSPTAVYFNNGGAALDNLQIVGCTIRSNGTPTLGMGGIYLSGPATPTPATAFNNLLIRDNLIEDNYGHGVMVEGTLGTQIINNTVRRSQLGGDVGASGGVNIGLFWSANGLIDGNTSSDAGRQGIALYFASQSTVQNNDVLASAVAAVYLRYKVAGYTGACLVRSNLVAGCVDGFQLRNSHDDAVVRYNSITSCTGRGIYNLNNAGSTLMAEMNWWGSATGPAHASNPGGNGTAIANYYGGNLTDFSPWLGDGTDTQPGVTGFQPNVSPIYYTPHHLVFSTEPGGAGINAPLTPQPVVQVIDENSTLATAFNGSVTLAINTGTAGATMTTTLTQPVVGGVATFSGLQIDRAGTYTLSAASASPVIPATSTSFVIANSLPSIASLSPAWAVAGDAGFTLTVNGADFVYNSVVRWNGSDRVTSFVNSGQLTATITAADIAAIGTANVTVFNVAPGGGESTPATSFEIKSVPTVVWVDDSFTSGSSGGHLWGYDAFTAIQAGVNRVAAGGTVHVAAGTYDESVSANKTVSLLGPQAGVAGYDASRPAAGGEAIITGVISHGGVQVQANNVVVDGFLIEQADTGTYQQGVHLSAAHSGARIDNNIIRDNTMGIYLAGEGTQPTLIRRNLLDANNRPGPASGDAVYSDVRVSNVLFADNQLVSNKVAMVLVAGVYGSYGPVTGFTVSNNVVNGAGTGGGFGISGQANAWFGGSDTDLRFVNNTITNLGTGRSALLLVGVDQAVVSANKISGAGNALDIQYAGTSIVVSNNVLTGNNRGVFVGGWAFRDQLTILDNDIENNLTANLENAQNDDISFWDIPVNASGNWWGAASETAIDAVTTGVVDFTPYLPVATDVGGDPADGFQGNFSTLHVTALGAQSGSVGRVQEGHDLATTGGTVSVEAGTYTEVGQVVISKDLSIAGADKLTTIIKPDSDTGTDGDARAWFLIGAGKSFNLQKVTLDGTGHQVYHGLRHHGSGTILDCAFASIRHGVFEGTAIAVHSPGNVDVTGCTFANIGRNGVATYDAPTGIYSGNTYTGKGAGNWMDYAFLIQWGANVTVQNNVISDCVGVYTEGASSWGSSGIAVWDDPGTTAVLTGNALNNNSVGLAVAVISGTDWGTGLEPVVNIGAGNTFVGGEIGVDVENVGVTAASPAITFGASTFKGQSSQAISFQTGMSEGISYDISSVVFKDNSDVVITDNFAKEDLVYHVVDAYDRGLLVWNSSKDYVTPLSASIQRGVDAASAGWTVNVKSGSYTETVNVNKALVVSLGASPAQVIVNGDWAMSSGSSLVMELNGTTPGADHDQLVVNGTVNLGGATLSATSAFSYAAGANVILIANDGTDAVTGTFAGLPNASTLTLGGQQFTIYYNGGDGNDVALFRSGDLGTYATVYVDDTFPNPVPGQDPDAGGPAQYFMYDSFPTVQGGVNAVTSGGTVNVAAGSYAENVTVNQAVTLKGANFGVAGCTGRGPESAIAGGVGTALTIASDDVTVDGLATTGVIGISARNHIGVVVQNNLVNAVAVGIDAGTFATTALKNVSLAGNCISLTGQLAGSTPTVGLVLTGVSGAQAPVLSDNSISGAFYGYLLYAVQADAPTVVSGGTVTGAKQGVAVINVDPLTGTVYLPSTFTVDGVSLSGFTGDHPASPANNFHAGVYVFTGGSDTAAKITGTVKNVSVAGTGKIQGDCAALNFSDYSTGAGTRQDITVQDCTLENNLNRGINIRGTNAEVDITRCTLADNGGDPIGTGGNHGFGIIVRSNAVVTVTESFITNPGSQAGYTVTALAIDENPTVTVSNCSIDNNGNASGKLATRSSGTLNASGNWWGDSDEATIAGLITGSVDFTPYLDDGTDTVGDETDGFQGDFSILHVTTLGAQTGSAGRIQEGHDLTSGSTVIVEAGTYAESVAISKDDFRLQAALNADVDARGARNAESIMDSSAANGVIQIAADNVTIDGLKIGPSAVYGVYVLGESANVQVLNTIVAGASSDGIILYRASSATVEQCWVQNCALTGISGGDSDSPTHLLTEATIQNNKVENCRFGISGYLANSTISGNEVGGLVSTAGQAAGIGGQFYDSTINDNTISSYTGTQQVGIGLVGRPDLSRPAPHDVSIEGNTVSGAFAGIYVAADTTESISIINDNSVTGCTLGVAIYGAATVMDNPASFTGNGIGILVSGSTAKALIENNDLTANSVAGIRVENGATVDAGDCSGGDVTGLGSSAGGNTLTGYSVSVPAIVNANAGGTPAVLGYQNDYGITAGTGLASVLSGNVLASQSGGLLVTPTLPPITVECVGDVPGASNTLAGFQALGGAVSATAGVTVTPSDGSLTPGPTEGTITRTYTLTDVCGETANSTQLITVNDTIAPLANAGSIAICYTTVGAAEAAAIAATTVSDNCTATPSKAASTAGLDPATVTVTVSDQGGNSTNVSYTTRIDDTAPVITSTAATQFAANVKNGAATVLQGTSANGVQITVVASDTHLVVPPTVALVNGASNEVAVFDSQSPAGTFNYHWDVTPATANGTWTATVTASDLCNDTTDVFTLDLNKTEITGTVQLEGFVGNVTNRSRAVTFVATTNSPTVTNVVATWSVTLTNAAGDEFAYKLTGVPAGTTGLSAKTDWHLRRRLSATLDVNGQAVVNFSGLGGFLKAGDIAHAGVSGNAVVLDDYTTLVGVWFGSDPVADINGDGIVNVFDYALLSFNWYSVGDPE